ncbi:MAG: phenylacetate-CoA oxygenase subunit PaaC [Saprospiraceae bacterium]|nr:phenylacetate-CoA oxygenase subunit PaaC [Saprospiraceae bacterium]
MNTTSQYIIQLADNALILGQRLSEWCGHGPVLEQDIAITNITLDLIGEARSLFQYAAQLLQSDEDKLAFLRLEHEYKNVLLVEQPNTDWAHTTVRQFLFDTYHYFLYQQLRNSSDITLATIAEKTLKEVTYQLRYSSEWTIRLGDGTAVSHEKMQTALDNLWQFSGELFVPNIIETAAVKAGIGADLALIQQQFEQKTTEVFSRATLQIPSNVWMQQGGKDGRHTENFGFILSEMQYMQRAYPNMEW